MSSVSPPTQIDVSGLPKSVILNIQHLVDSLRQQVQWEDSTRSANTLLGRLTEADKEIPGEVIDQAQNELWDQFTSKIEDSSQL